MSPNQQSYSMPFWDFIQSLDPNQGNGRGVDHTASQPSAFPTFGAGFPFGGPGHYGAHPPPPPGPPGSHPPPPYGSGFEYGPWFHGGMGGPWDHHDRRHHHRGRRHRGAMNEGEPSGEDDWISASDVERDVNDEKRDSPDTMRVDAPDPEEVAPEDDQAPPHPRFGRRGGCGGRGGRGGGHFGGRGGRGRCGGRGGRGGFFGRGGPGSRFGPHRGPGEFPGSPYSRQSFPFDFGGFMRGCANHPLMRNIREHAQRFQEAYGPENDDDTFTPPVDIFDTETAFVLHVSLPGAKKEEIGVNWDADHSLLNIAGVIHRPGDEAFLSSLTSSERKVGMFERNVTLPPKDSERPDEVDGSGITATMEDGILIITVPKVEREWTEVRKVDIQ